MDEWLNKAVENGALFAVTMMVLWRVDARMASLVERLDRLLDRLEPRTTQ